MENGVQDAPLRKVLERWPWIAAQRRWEAFPEKLLVSFESKDGSGVLKMDQPLSSFAERRFGARFVRSEWIPFPSGGAPCSCIEFILILAAGRLDVTCPIPTSFIPPFVGPSAHRTENALKVNSCGDLSRRPIPAGCPRILVQSRTKPDWEGIGVKGWLAKADPAIDLNQRLKLDLLKVKQRFRFRLRANPCVTRNGKRLGLLQLEEQEAWIERKGLQHGFSLPKLASFDLSDSLPVRTDVQISHEQMLQGNQHSGNGVQIFSVLYDGILTVTDPEKFRNALQNGIGHGKVMGLGLLSVVPTT